MGTARKLLLGAVGIGVGLTALAGLAVGWIAWGPPPRFDQPAPEIAASTDPDAVARGAYLFHAVAHCTDCHAPGSKDALTQRPLPVGGEGVHTPFGSFYPNNLTPDPTAGIGALTDAELARVVRYGIAPDGRLSPFMSLATGSFTDEDLADLIAYLRSLPADPTPTPPSEPNLIGRALVVTGILVPKDRATPPFAAAGPPSIARGRYLAEGPANCIACHTDGDMMNGNAWKNPPFSGGRPHVVSGEHTLEITPPNLTPHPERGAMRGWTEDRFVARFKEDGRTLPGTIMPWENYAQLTEDDLRSLYRFLTSLDPVDHDPGPVVAQR